MVFFWMTFNLIFLGSGGYLVYEGKDMYGYILLGAGLLSLLSTIYYYGYSKDGKKKRSSWDCPTYFDCPVVPVDCPSVHHVDCDKMTPDCSPDCTPDCSPDCPTP